MDNFKIMYKILRELEKNMGDEKFSLYSISAEHLKIPYNQWEQLLIMMLDDGYIRGIVVDKTLDDKFRHIVEPIFPEITIKGLDYLSNNNQMSKAKEALKLAGEII